MNQISLITELIYKQQQQELLKELADYRLVNDAIRANKENRIARSKILLKVGKLLQSAGQTLENRHGEYLDLDTPRRQEPNHGECA